MTSVEQAPVDAQEIGAIFANEYYTFLSKEPARLHCFYSKDSTLSHGFQGEVTEVCVGQQAIKAKIGGLDFKDCRVLLTNIDCQQSFGGSIIIQILGELANRGGPAQKFSQTFLLAEQPKGYYVLNDIFRYLKDDYDDEDIVEQEVEAPKTEEDAPIQIQVEVQPVEPIVEEEAVASVPAPIVEEEAIKVTETIITVEVEAPEPADDKKDKKKAERKPDRKKDNKKEIKKDEPSPVSTPTPEVEELQAPVVVEPPKAEAPKTWANLAAKNSTQWGANVAPAKASVTVSAPAPPAPTPAPTSVATKIPVQKPHPHGDRPRVEYHSIYIKNVTERMTLEQLREAFTKFGTVKHLEYARVRNCAFLDFSTPEAMNAALKQAHVPVGSEHVLAEERRRNSNPNGFQNNRPFYNNNNNNNSNNNTNNQHNGSGSHIPRSEQKPFTNGHQSTQGGRGRGGHRGRGGFHNRPDTVAPAVAVK